LPHGNTHHSSPRQVSLITRNSSGSKLWAKTRLLGTDVQTTVQVVRKEKKRKKEKVSRREKRGGEQRRLNVTQLLERISWACLLTKVALIGWTCSSSVEVVTKHMEDTTRRISWIQHGTKQGTNTRVATAHKIGDASPMGQKLLSNFFVIIQFLDNN